MRQQHGPSPAAQVPQRVYRVSQLNGEIHELLEEAYPDIWLEGEISNYRVIEASGHWYFTLKDSKAQIAAAMFRSQNRRLRLQPENGMHVLVHGQVSLYEARGTYQIIVDQLEPRGTGALHAAFEQLKRRLAAEGLFDQDRKRPLPSLPRRVGVVTSRDGAALRDILRVLHRRHAGVSVLILPTRVQGDGAAGEIVAAIQRAGKLKDLDLLIISRGGGSLEDLWAFNEEAVARAIAACHLPTISAIGHEVDVTMADFVADLRAPTPSAAAEMMVASRDDMQETVGSLARRLDGATRLILSRLRAGPASNFAHVAAAPIGSRLRQTGQRCDDLSGRLRVVMERQVARARRRTDLLRSRLSPPGLLALVYSRRQRLETAIARLATAVVRCSRESRETLAMVTGRLQELSPLAVLARGYSLARLADSQVVLRDAAQITVGDQIDLLLHSGTLRLQVLRKQRRQTKR